MAKGSQIRKRQRRSRLPETKQAEIIARKLSGQSERAISRETGISRKAIARISTDSEYQEIVQRYRAEALELVPDSLRVIRKALAEALDPQTEQEPEPEKFGKIEVIDGRDLQRKLRDEYRRGYRHGMKSGTDGLKAALGSMNGTNVFSIRQQVDVNAKGDRFSGLTEEELDAKIREAEQKLREAKASEGEK